MATYVLIPGAGGDGWQWHRSSASCEARGHEAIAGRRCRPATTAPAGTSTPTRSWRRSAIGASIVLVAQSLAGFTAPLVCERLPVDLLVLLNAMIPMPGETGNDWWANTGSGGRDARVPRRDRAPARSGRRRQGRLLPRRARGHRRGGLRARRAAAVDDADEPAVPARGVAGRPDARPRRPRRPPVPARVPATGRPRATRHRGRRAARRPHARAQPTRASWRTYSRRIARVRNAEPATPCQAHVPRWPHEDPPSPPIDPEPARGGRRRRPPPVVGPEGRRDRVRR